MKMCECGRCDDCNQGNNIPGFGGTLRNTNSGMDMSFTSNENPNAGKIQFTPVTFETQDQLKDFVREIIRKVGSHYELKSHSGKNLGHFPTKGAAEKHEREVNYFKNKGK